MQSYYDFNRAEYLVYDDQKLLFVSDWAWRKSGLQRDATEEPLSQDYIILRREQEQGAFVFPLQLTTSSRFGGQTWWISKLCSCNSYDLPSMHIAVVVGILYYDNNINSSRQRDVL